MFINSKEEPGYDNIGKLNYMDMCINETMRMYPISPRYIYMHVILRRCQRFNNILYN